MRLSSGRTLVFLFRVPTRMRARGCEGEPEILYENSTHHPVRVEFGESRNAAPSATHHIREIGHVSVVHYRYRVTMSSAQESNAIRESHESKPGRRGCARLKGNTTGYVGSAEKFLSGHTMHTIGCTDRRSLSTCTLTELCTMAKSYHTGDNIPQIR
jgi:hypothetical protein